MTTPESLDLQRILADMLKDGVTHVIMEVTSHAIDLHRVDHCRLDVAVFTNLSQDHLDYHGSMESYWQCKKRMFTEILNSGPKKSLRSVVLNHNDEKGQELLSLFSEKAGPFSVLSVGTAADNNIRCQNIEYDLAGMRGRITTPGGTFEFKSPLVGRYNLENILCATGAGIALNLDLDTIKAGLEEVAGVPGRLESIANDIERFVYVDYAHTPDALDNVLSVLKKLATGKVICVFGCGGNRDSAKRPQMGAIASRLCDLTVITNDNPRTEPPQKIIDQILEGTNKAAVHEHTTLDLAAGFQQRGYVVEPDRKNAIQLAVLASRPGDTVLIAGKGDETYQVIKESIVPFDDRTEARTALSVLARISQEEHQTESLGKGS